MRRKGIGMQRKSERLSAPRRRAGRGGRGGRSRRRVGRSAAALNPPWLEPAEAGRHSQAKRESGFGVDT
jgi:hypothetical protein